MPPPPSCGLPPPSPPSPLCEAPYVGTLTAALSLRNFETERRPCPIGQVVTPDCDVMLLLARGRSRQPMRQYGRSHRVTIPKAFASPTCLTRGAGHAGAGRRPTSLVHRGSRVPQKPRQITSGREKERRRSRARERASRRRTIVKRGDADGESARGLAGRSQVTLTQGL